MEIKEHSIVIVEDSFKESFIESFRRGRGLFDIETLGLKEFKKRYYFDYTTETVFYVCKHLNVIDAVAKVYLENLYFVKDGINDEKLIFLSDLRDELEEHNLLVHDENFRRHLTGRDIVLYNLDTVDRFYEEMFEELSKIANVTTVQDPAVDRGKKPIYALANKDEEIAFVASQIVELIKSGVVIDHIKLANVSSDYSYALSRTFKDFNLPLELPNENSLSSSLLMKKFKEFYSGDISSTISSLASLVTNEADEYVYKKILAVVNDYCWCDDYEKVKDLIYADLAAIKGKSRTYKHAVRTIDFMTANIGDDDYVFLLNFNQGSIPMSKKDEDFLSDDLKRKLGMSDSVDLNKKMLAKLHVRIRSTSHLTVTYALRDLGGDLYVSNAYDDELFTKETPVISFEHSNAYNRRVLLCAKDENKKYGTTNETLERLLNHYKNEPYATFDNTFKGIDKNSLHEFLEGKLTLSYSSMNTYYKCAFRYYLDNILRINAFEDSFATAIGNIFHEVLSKCFLKPFDFEATWTKAIEHQEFPFGDMENFYLGLLKEELVFIIESITSQLTATNLNKALFEQRIVVPLDEEGNVVFKGFVDKILYDDTGEEKVAAIVDYKTGHPELNVDNVIYGLDMQLPIYAYLLKHFDRLKDATIGGFYLQKILNNAFDNEAKRNALKLQGYSNSNPRILQRVDTTYEDSSLIKSMKMSKGNFYAYTKVLSDDQISKMVTIVEEKIAEAAKNIMDGIFTIDPKEIAGDNVGCQYCTYRDICYVQNKDIKKLKKMKKEDFLGGEEDGLDQRTD